MTTIPMLGVPITIPDDLEREAQQAIARILISTGAASIHGRNRRPMTSVARYGATMVARRATAARAAAKGDSGAWRALRESDERCLRVAADQDRRSDEPLAEDVLAALIADVFLPTSSTDASAEWILGEETGTSACVRVAFHDFGDHVQGTCDRCSLAGEGRWRGLVAALGRHSVSQRLILDLHESLVLGGHMGDLAVRSPRDPEPPSRGALEESTRKRREDADYIF